jgi:hypothetical protein
MTFSDAMTTLDHVRHASPSLMSSKFYVEAVAYQQAARETRRAVDALVYLILGPGRRWHRAAKRPYVG